MSRQLHPEDLPRRNQLLAQHLAGETPAYVGEFRVRHPDGKYRWVRTHGRCVRDAEGKPLRMAGSTSDVDARKRAEEQLRQSEERYALAMAGSRGGHWVWDTATDALFVSDKVNELFGLATDAGCRTRERFLAQVKLHPEDRERLAAIEADLLSGRVERSDYEFRILLPEGERWILTRAQRFETGQSLRLAGVSVDIGERKRAEAERQRLEEQLRQAQKLEAIGTLAGGIAHDFNNILAAILGYGELAQQGAAEGTEQWRHLEAAIAAGQRAKSLVERILAFSRSGVGERAPVHVQSVVGEALDAVAAGAPPGVRLSRKLAAGDAGVLGDPTQIHQVVMNLCANAVQAMRSEGSLDVGLDAVRLEASLAVATSTLPEGSYVRLVVADNGSGIAPGVLSPDLRPVLHDQGSRRRHRARPVAGPRHRHRPRRRYRGRERGRRRQPVHRLPAVVRRWSRRPRSGRPGRRVHGDGQTVLLVDDEEPLVRLGEETLAALGYEPVGFTSARAALEALAADARAVRRAAVRRGDAGHHRLGARPPGPGARPRLPILLMSGYVTPALVERAHAIGAVEVLAKPLAAHEIARALAAAVAGGGSTGPNACNLRRTVRC